VIRPGQLTCLMGASGAGRTALVDGLGGGKTEGVIGVRRITIAGDLFVSRRKHAV